MARMASGKATGARSVPGKYTEAEPVIALRPESMHSVVDFAKAAGRLNTLDRHDVSSVGCEWLKRGHASRRPGSSRTSGCGSRQE
jgi:hypothetical protein